MIRIVHSALQLARGEFSSRKISVVEEFAEGPGIADGALEFDGQKSGMHLPHRRLVSLLNRHR